MDQITPNAPVATSLFHPVFRFVRSHPDLLTVLAAGLVGGLLAPSVSALISNKGDLSTYAVPPIGFGKYMLFALFGALAAGLSVYLLANSEKSDLKRLFFFALICGITFPTVFAQAASKQFEESEIRLDTARALSSATDAAPAKKAAVSEELVVTALKDAPADEVDRRTKQSIAADATKVVENLKPYQAADPNVGSALAAIRDQAMRSGYENVAAAVGPIQPPAPAIAKEEAP